MNDLILLVLCSLAVFRLTELVAFDEGPFGVFRRIRNLFPQDSLIDQMLECPYCGSVWWSLILSFFLLWIGAIQQWSAPVWWLAIAGGAIVIIRTIRPRD